MRLSDYLKQNGMTTKQFFEMQERKANGVTTLGDYQRKTKADFLKRVQNLNNEYSNLYNSYSSRFFDKDGNFVGGYNRDDSDIEYKKYSQTQSKLQNEIIEVENFLKKNGSNYDKETLSKLTSFLFEAKNNLNKMGSAYEFYSNFHTEYDYNDYLMSNTDGLDADSIKTRQTAYESNVARIKAIDEEIANMPDEKKWKKEYKAGGGGYLYEDLVETDAYKKLLDEKTKIQQYNTKYKNGLYESDTELSKHMGAEDYAEDSQKRDFKTPSSEEIRLFSLGVDAEGNKVEYNPHNFTITDPLGTYLNATEEEIYTAIESGYTAIPSSAGITLSESEMEAIRNYEKTLRDGDIGGWEHLEEEEIGLYYYFLNNDMEDEALSYLKGMEVVLDRRANEKQIESLESATPLELVFHNVASVPANIVGGGLAFISDTFDYLQGEGINPYSGGHNLQNYAQNVRAATANDLNEWTGNAEFLRTSLGDAYQSVMSGIDSLVGSVTMGKGYAIVMGMGAAASKAKELYEAGASNEKIAISSLLAGAAEMVFEKLSIDYFLDNFIKSPTKNFGKLILQALTQGGIELTEEAATEIANTFTDAVVLGSQSDWQQLITKYKDLGYSDSEAMTKALGDIGGDVLESGIGGFISGAFMGGGGALINLAQNKSAENKVVKAEGGKIVSKNNVEALVEITKSLPDSPASSKLKALADEVSGVDVFKLSEREQAAFSKKVGKLYSSVADAQTNALTTIVDDSVANIIRDKLEEKGITNETEVKKAIKAIKKVVYGNEQLSIAESNLMDKVGGKEIANYLLNNKTDVIAKANVTAEQRYAQAEKTASLTKSENAEVRSINTEDYDFSDDGKTYIKGTDESVEITGVSSIKDGEMIVNLSNGTTASLTKLSLGSESQAIIYEGILGMGIDAASAQAIANAFDYDSNSSISATTYIMGMQDAVKYGKMGGKAFLDSGVFTSELTAKQREMGYEIGRITAENEAKRAAEKIKTSIKANKKGNLKLGNVSFEGITEKDLDIRQKTTVKVLEQLFGNRGMNIVFFKSPVNEKGTHIKENGSFDPKTNTIRLDINAGSQGNDTILFTAAHELTHFIRLWSPEKFKVFADFLVDNYAKHGVSIDVLIQNQIRKAKDCGMEMDDDTAYEEIIADSCETFLRDSKLLDRLIDLAKKDMTLFEKTQLYIANLLADLQKCYNDFEPDSPEARKVLEWTDCIGNLHKLWEEAALAALDNSQRAGGKILRTTASEGDVKFSARDTRYWYPNMKKTEVANVRRIAKRELNTTDNYIDIENKWLYNKTGQNTYFALYSTEDANEPTILYACKGNRAEFEHQFLIKQYEKEVNTNGSINTESRLVVRLLSSIEDAFGEKNVHSRNTMGRGSNNRNVGVYSKNKGNRLSEAFLDCLRNIAEIQERNGVEKPSHQDNHGNGFKKTRNNDAESHQSTDSSDNEQVAFKTKYSLAKLTDNNLIATAEQMERDGATREEIWRECQIVRDVDGVWIYEIDDSAMVFYPDGNALIKDDSEYEEFEALSNMDSWTDEQADRYADLEAKFMTEYGYGPWLKNYLVHDELYKKYPQLKDAVLEVASDNKRYAGSYNPKTNTILITESIMRGNRFELNMTVIHEIQHALQAYDERQRGASVEYWNTRILNGEIPRNPRTGKAYTAKDAYYNTAGEIEAYLSQDRYLLYPSAAARKESMPNLGWEKAIRADKQNPKVKHSISVDAEYLYAIESNKIETVQQMVDAAARNAGYTERLYHQTNADFTEFTTDKQKAGKYDWELPTGTFLKPTDEDIGLSGKKQMELYAKFDNPLEFANRYAAQKFWSDNIVGYAEAAQIVKDIDVEYRMKSDMAINAVQAYKKKWRMDNPNADSRELYNDLKFQRLDSEEDRIIEEWERKSDEASLKAKQLIDVFIAANDYDGIIVERDQGSFGRYTKTYIVFDSSQLKDAAPITYDDNGNVIPLSERFNARKTDIRYSGRDYSYNTLINKPDMKITFVDVEIPNNRTDIILNAKRNAASIGKINKNGSVSVYVDDLGSDVLLGTDGLKHGLRRTKDIKENANYIVTVKAGEIIKNSIKVNQMLPRKDAASASYVLLGAAMNDDGDLYIVRSIVNEFNNELSSMDVLYAINTKKETAVTKSPRFTAMPLSDTVSTISISDLLDYVNKYFPDTLPESVLKHYGYTERPDGDLGKNILFSNRDPEAIEQYEKINAQLAKENIKLVEDIKDLKEFIKLQRQLTHGKMFSKSSLDIVAKRLMAYSNAKGNRAELVSLLNDVYGHIANGEDVTWESIRDKALAAAEWLQTHEAREQMRDEFVNEVLKTLRASRVTFSDVQKEEAAYLYGSFGNYRKRNMGKIIIANEGIPLDSQWQEWAELYPMYFNKDTTESDQPAMLVSILDSLQNSYIGGEAYYYESEMVTQDLITRIYDEYWNVGTLHTVADSKQKEIALLKSKHANQIKAVRDFHNDKHAKLKQEQKERITMLRTQYREREEAKLKKAAQNYQKSRKAAIEKVRETRDKRDAITKLQRLVLDTAKWISYPSKDAIKCPDILRAPYAELLSSIDLSSKRLLNGGEPTRNDLRVSSAMDSLATAIAAKLDTQSPETTTETVLDTGYLDLPAYFVDNLRKLSEDLKKRMVIDGHIVNSMTSDEIKSLIKFIKTLNHSIKEMSTLYSNMRFARVEQLGNDTMLFLNDLGEHKQVRSLASFVTWDNALPYYTFKRFGVGGESVFEELMDAQDKLAFLADEIFKFKEKTWSNKEASEWSKDTHTIELPSGRKLTLTSADAMSIYCLSRRGQGRQHLLGGGVRVLGIEKNGKKVNDSRSTLNIEDVHAICSSLSQKQREVAEAIQEYMSTVCAEWGNEISMKRFLTKEFTEKFYFPIESNDENLDTKDPQAQQSDLYRLLNISATKPLTKKANNEVIVRNIFDVFSNHSSDMAKLNAFGMPLLDYMKWINYREKTTNDEGQISVNGVRKSMEKAYGPEAKKYVINLIKDINGRFNDNGDNKFLMKMMRGAKTAMVGANLRVSMLQFTAYPRAAMVLSNKSLALALTKKPQIEKAKQYCGIALWKSFGFYDTNISKSIEEQFKGTTNIRQKLIELSLKGAELGDAITWGCLWNACEYEVAKTKQYKVGSEEFNQAVGKKLREVVYATQVVDSTLTRSQMMRSKSGLTQAASAFMSEPTLSTNILMDAGFQFNLEKRRTGSAKLAWKKTGKYVGKAVAVYSVSQLFAALVEGLMDAYRDDDDEEFKDKFKTAFMENAISDINPLNKIPIVADISEMLLSLADIGFYSSNSLYSTATDEFKNAFEIWSKVINGEDGKTVYAGIYSTTKLLSYITGVSASGVMREGVTLWNNTAGAADPYLKVRTYETTTTDVNLAEYYFDKNDTASVKITVSQMISDKVKSGKTEKEARSAVRTSFTSAYKSEYISAAKTGNYTEMNRIRKLLYSTGLYGTLSELDATLKEWRTSK